MAPKNRPRACEPCHSLKIRCELSLSDAAPPCQRCQRLDKECIIAPPRRQRDRIAELESKIEELTRLLQSQGIESSSTTTPDSPLAQPPDQGAVRSGQYSTDAKKRKTSNEILRNLDADSPSNDSWSEAAKDSSSMDRERFEICAKLDSRISTTLQQQVLDVYTGSIVPKYPIVPISAGSSLTQLRLESPTLLLVILAFATSGLLPQARQSELVRDATVECATSMIAVGNRSIEIVNALIIASLWYRSPHPTGISRLRHGSIYQLVQLATGAAIEVGIAGPQSWSSGAFEKVVEDTASIDARRAWLACFTATSAVAVVMRRWDTNAAWTIYNDECLNYLSASPDALPTDRLFCQMVRGELLCNRIATQLNLCEASQLLQLSDPVTLYISRSLRQQIDEWTAQVPVDLQQPHVLLWRHIALICVNEIILHTSTNKTSFGAPFLEDRINPTDFAAPALNPDYIAAIHTLKDSAQTVLDLFLRMQPETIIALPTLVYSPRMLYALLILIKTYVAVAAPGNTYGSVLSRDELRLEHYFGRLATLTASLRSIDASASTTRLFAASVRLENWFVGYRATVDRYEANLANGLTSIPTGGLDFHLQDSDLPVSDGQGPDLWDDFWMDTADTSWLSNLFSEPATTDLNAGLFG